MDEGQGELIELIPENKKILIFAPHPDDEIIGMGATIYKIRERGNIFKIAYLTDGERGVKGDLSDEEKKGIRRGEAIRACAVLGVKEKDLEFLDLPFYRTRMPDVEDIEIVFDLITIFMPDIIFVCVDEDPNSTHRKAAQIIDEALIQYEIDTIIYCYKSIWEEFKLREVNFCIGFDESLMRLKIKALKEHKSQLENLGDRENPIWLKVKERDRRLAQKLKLKTPYAEGFFRTETL